MVLQSTAVPGNVLDEIHLDRSLNLEDTTKKSKMLAILENSNQQIGTDLGELNSMLDESDYLDSDDDDTCLDIEDRLAGVNLDDAEEVWSRLAEDEKQDFIAFLKSGDVDKLITSWEPWWLSDTEKLIEDVGSNESSKKVYPDVCQIKDFHEITTKTPSESVKYNLVNIISAYAFTTRYFNGEHLNFAKEATSSITSLSLTLRTSENFMDFETAVKSVQQECINSSWIIAGEESFKTLKDDVYKIFEGLKKSDNKFYLLCALSDLHNLFVESLQPLRCDNNSEFHKKFPKHHFSHVNMTRRSDIKKCIKKIEYYLSFTKCCYDNLLSYT
ncbi:hypothetical protein NQ315_001901 [Exocentrus adspersus]|uniref:Uncharacterized protein n=1 Tax=Exocentrus adspersus TaxID=1586481 RepID=A0AAV8WAJ8_9CUCU|nr:hypothetical protein NQ315_001901 [Exocentrus adspersus]